ncbi:MAG: hypothetical protein ACKO5E_06370 [bacterium]
MNLTALAVSYLLSALLVYAWYREHRLRRALQALFARVFNHWNRHEPTRNDPHQDYPRRHDYRQPRHRRM